MNDQALTVVEPQPIEAPAPSAIFGNSPATVIANATSAANALKSVLKAQGLITNIQGKEYPRCEAWTLLGTMVGMFPVLVWSKPVDGGWEARVEARLRDGTVVGAAEAQCTRSESSWAKRDDYAIRSMAQTRATAKALRMPLGFVMTLAGYEPTPAEEMTQQHSQQPAGRTTTHNPPIHTTSPPKAAAATPKAKGSALGLAEKCKARFLAIISDRKLEKEAWIYAIANDWIFTTERFSDARPDKFPITAEAADKLLDEIEQVTIKLKEAGGMSQEEAEAYDAAHFPQEEFSLDKRKDEPWRSIPIPQWSKHFKEDGHKTFGELDKEQLWWWAVRWQPTGYKGKPPKAEDVALRAELDKVREMYNFTESKEAQQSS